MDNQEKALLEIDFLGEEHMSTKFFSFECIILYACIEYTVAAQMTQLDKPTDLIITPLNLYESSYMAKELSPISSQRQLMAFAVYVQDDVFDELDLELEDKIRESGKSENELRRNSAVVRRLETHEDKSYIVYIVQNQNAIKAVFPMQG